MPLRIYEECAQIASNAGCPPSQPLRDLSLQTLTTKRSPLTASMLRDIEIHGRTEADQILGDMLRRRRSSDAATGAISLLELAHLHVRAYEARRRRELGDPI